jgi:hypothetical protein
MNEKEENIDNCPLFWAILTFIIYLVVNTVVLNI